MSGYLKSMTDTKAIVSEKPHPSLGHGWPSRGCVPGSSCSSTTDDSVSRVSLLKNCYCCTMLRRNFVKPVNFSCPKLWVLFVFWGLKSLPSKEEMFQFRENSYRQHQSALFQFVKITSSLFCPLNTFYWWNTISFVFLI